MLAPSDLAFEGSGCVSMNSPSAPVGDACAGYGLDELGMPPVTPDVWLDCCRECVTSSITGYPNVCISGMPR